MQNPYEQVLCKLCGDPMPKGEEMFKYHGYSGTCPKEPLNIIRPIDPRDTKLATLTAENEKLKAELEGARRVIEFYGDEENWVIRKYGRANACEYYSYRDQIHDSDTDLDHFETRKKRTIAGKRAREWIAKNPVNVGGVKDE